MGTGPAPTRRSEWGGLISTNNADSHTVNPQLQSVTRVSPAGSAARQTFLGLFGKVAKFLLGIGRQLLGSGAGAVQDAGDGDVYVQSDAVVGMTGHPRHVGGLEFQVPALQPGRDQGRRAGFQPLGSTSPAWRRTSPRMRPRTAAARRSRARPLAGGRSSFPWDLYYMGCYRLPPSAWVRVSVSPG